MSVFKLYYGQGVLIEYVFSLCSSLSFSHKVHQLKIFFIYSAGASERPFHPIFNKRFHHLETLVTIQRPKKTLSAGSLCGPLVPSPQSKCPKRTFILPRNMLSSQLKCFIENENKHRFQGPILGQTPAKCWVKGFILPHKYHDPNFYRRF